MGRTGRSPRPGGRGRHYRVPGVRGMPPPLPLTAAFMSMQGDVDARKREALAEPETEAAILYQRRGPSHPRPLRTGARPRPTPPVDTRWMRSG